MENVYRFRNMEQLLDEHEELETQTIYFASPDELDDPMDGLSDIVWRGDVIVWLNLFKHYIHCLHWAFSEVSIIGDTAEYTPSDIKVSGRWDEPPTSSLGDLFSEVWGTVRDDLRVSLMSTRIAAMNRDVTQKELLVYLTVIHYYALVTIKRIHSERGLDSPPDQQLQELLSPPSALTESSFFELMKQLEASDDQIDTMFTAFYSIISDIILAVRFSHRNNSSGVFAANTQLVLLDFPRCYVQQLKELLWPHWYTACFSKSYYNSSVWSRYADGHEGICLVFETTKSGDHYSLPLSGPVVSGSHSWSGTRDNTEAVPKTFYDIDYQDQLVRVDFFRNLGRLPRPVLINLWYTSEDGRVSECGSFVTGGTDEHSWRNNHWQLLYRSACRKTADWEYEEECRLILKGGLDPYVDRQHRVLKYEFDSLKGIIFGINTSDEDKVRIMEIIRKKCLDHNRASFQFFQAYYSPVHGNIQREEIRIGLVPAVTTPDQDTDPG